ETGYFSHKRQFGNRCQTLKFSAQFSGMGLAIFFFCRFPLHGAGLYLMMVAVGIEYALMAYVGRKLIWTGMMLHSLLKAKITRNLFAKRELDDINTYVNVASTLTIIFV